MPTLSRARTLQFRTHPCVAPVPLRRSVVHDFIPVPMRRSAPMHSTLRLLAPVRLPARYSQARLAPVLPLLGLLRRPTSLLCNASRNQSLPFRFLLLCK